MEPHSIGTTLPAFASDPVCGMRVAIDGAQHVSELEGVTYYFCGRGCRLEFEDEPERYLSSDHQPSMEDH